MNAGRRLVWNHKEVVTMRGLYDREGEQFGYVRANTVYTLEGEPTGHLQGEFVVDLAGQPMWRRIGDGIYSVDGTETIGYLTDEKPEKYD